MIETIIPNWLAPSGVKAYTTTRQGGASVGPYTSLNLADHVDDDLQTVLANRQTLRQALNLPNEPCWLKQVHSINVVSSHSTTNCSADAVYTNQINQVCAVMTADCLPVLFCNRQATWVAAAHAGWRGLANGILENTIQAANIPPGDILAWLGPAIGPTAFEVGNDVRDAFIQTLPQAGEAFKSSKNGHWLANLYLLAKQRLQKQGVMEISGGDFCTYTDEQRFYSYRRDKVTGRMASLIWLSQEN